MSEYIKKSEAVDVIVKYPYDIAGKTATAIKMIEDLPSADVVPKSDVEKLIIDRNAARLGMIAEHERLEIARADIERLHGILLQFTDIVHKWGAKNNIDTSEISLVPILQEEADSIIKKANQEAAREIFAEIESLIDGKFSINHGVVLMSKEDFAELKKKYEVKTK